MTMPTPAQLDAARADALDRLEKAARDCWALGTLFDPRTAGAAGLAALGYALPVLTITLNPFTVRATLHPTTDTGQIVDVFTIDHQHRAN